jgi:hypothetical protein
VEKAGREIKLQFLEEIQGLIVPHYAQEWRKKCKFKVKLNDYWTICIKIKSNDIIKFLIGQFDLIMGLIEF